MILGIGWLFIHERHPKAASEGLSPEAQRFMAEQAERVIFERAVGAVHERIIAGEKEKPEQPQKAG
jgi:hypothetical protein